MDINALNSTTLCVPDKNHDRGPRELITNPCVNSPRLPRSMALGGEPRPALLEMALTAIQDHLHLGSLALWFLPAESGLQALHDLLPLLHGRGILDGDFLDFQVAPPHHPWLTEALRRGSHGSSPAQHRQNNRGRRPAAKSRRHVPRVHRLRGLVGWVHQYQRFVHGPSPGQDGNPSTPDCVKRPLEECGCERLRRWRRAAGCCLVNTEGSDPLKESNSQRGPAHAAQISILGIVYSLQLGPPLHEKHKPSALTGLVGAQDLIDQRITRFRRIPGGQIHLQP
mmetsp:Transcript_127829/g.292077  ORF Transcript_127829/g.292077 Transcript_127829/m.292077 type:complete len:282 (-) Transcript_127829:359-1204(-)